MTPTETLIVDHSHTACDGGRGSLGHPRVYLTLDKSGTIDCPYCGRRYILKGSPAERAENAHLAYGS